MEWACFITVLYLDNEKAEICEALPVLAALPTMVQTLLYRTLCAATNAAANGEAMHSTHTKKQLQ